MCLKSFCHFFLAAVLVTLCISRADAAPNVILFLVDDLGYADLGCMGAKDIRTPHIDRLAAEGVRMTDFYANAPVCSPTRAALITGRWQQRCGIEWAIGLTSQEEKRVDGGWQPVSEPFTLGLAPESRHLVPQLRAKGYRTACFGKWHLGFLPEHNPIKHGFDEYWGILGGQGDYYRYHYVNGMKQLYEKDQPTTAEGYITDLIHQRVLRHIHETVDRPFFIYVPYTAVHHPFQPPDDPSQFYTDENKYHGTRAGYTKMVERVDHGVGLILAALEERRILDDTLIIFTSDNGGERFSDNRPFFNHKTTLWEGGIRVPCLLRWPAGRLPKGTVCDQPSITMDLTATVLAAAGISPAAPLDGIDLLPILRGEKPAQERSLCWRVDRNRRKMKAIRHGPWKYVQDDLVEMLFDLRNDPGERHDLYYQHPQKVEDLKARLTAWETEVDQPVPPIRIR